MNNFLFKNLIKIITFFAIITIYFTTSINAESGVSAFMYHRFGEDKYPSTNVSEAQFLSHIEYILKNKIPVYSLEDVIETVENNETFDQKAVAFSVDDAFKSFYEIAWPVFRENNIPVTLFISTDIIDKNTKGYMNWDEIRTYINEGGMIGQHTSTHLHMPLKDQKYIKDDILDSHKSFIKNIGFIPKLFAYPYGESSKSVIEVLKQFGILFAFGQHSGIISSYSNPHYLPRFSLNERFGELERFEFAANAHALLVEDFLPTEIYLEKNSKPTIEFSFMNNLRGNAIDCFSNPGGSWNLQEVINIKSNRIQINLKEKYNEGRARLNCTVKVENLWYWFGHQFLVK